MGRIEATRTASLAATAIVLVVATFIVARAGHKSSIFRPDLGEQDTGSAHPARTTHHQRATIEARAPAPSPKGVYCSLPIPNGQVLEQNWGIFWTRHANTLSIENHSGYNAILKLRDIMLGHTRASLFIASNSRAIYDRIPAGKYLIDYAVGDRLDEACMTFVHPVHTGQLGLVGFTGQEPARGTVYGRQEIAIPAPADQDAGLDSIGNDVFDFD